ncbi:hypothetical protein FEE95_10040 [Maribacter algarum]|uniref:Uncharacterized protein n=1 Tax=Maribacter algarum (ex Zhang et al. 2020) TaxID=2578118 RepID=A0A5S3PQ52_9FLAO|nr:hypothetical protein [Maribacter algarum]TMM56832.1 hypothetical protein FEE95_10040 [Maribacter algarum]
MKLFGKRLLVFLAIIVLILLIPLVAMQFTDKVNWGLGDFLIAGFLLFTTAILIELLTQGIPNRTHRLVLISLVFLGFLLLWAELAVGIFGSGIAGD